MSTASIALGTLAGVRDLASLRRDELLAMGEEASDLAQVVDLGVPLGAIWVIGLSDDAEGRVLAAVSAALALDLPRPVVELSGFYTTHALGARCWRVWPRRLALRRGDDVRVRVREFFRVLESSEVLVALGGVRTEVGIRVTVRDEGPAGWAASVDPRSGDPDVVAVGAEAGAPFLLDRKTMRLLREGGGELRVDVVERAADLADRAQLALGRPVELAFGHLRGRLVVFAVRRLELAPCFTDGSFKRVWLLSSDEGPIAPLAIEALDKALRPLRGSLADVPQVVRYYARAYRRADRAGARDEDRAGASLVRAAARAAQIAADLARPVAAVRAFEERLEDRLAEFDRQQFGNADAPTLLAALRDRQRLVVEAVALLESARIATLTAVSALEAACGTLPRECVTGLAAIRKTRARRRVEERLRRFARHLVDQLGEIPEPHRIPASMRRRWDETRAELANVRPLGLDVRPLPFGASDRDLRAVLISMLETTPDAEETARREAVRRLLATARVRPLGRARETLARSVVLGLSQLAEVKGRLAEGLATSLLRIRAAACAIGARLVEQGILELPDDALYLDVGEIEDAICGEPGAYASRVRLRREADLRWRHYDPPRRLAARVDCA